MMQSFLTVKLGTSTICLRTRRTVRDTAVLQDDCNGGEIDLLFIHNNNLHLLTCISCNYFIFGFRPVILIFVSCSFPLFFIPLFLL